MLHVRAASVDLQFRLDDKNSNSSSDMCSEISVPLDAIGAFSSTKARFWVKAALGPQKDNSLIEHKVIFHSKRFLLQLTLIYF